MATILHKDFEDGSFEHEELTASNWTAAMHDKRLVGFWGHPEECCRPAATSLKFFRKKQEPANQPPDQGVAAAVEPLPITWPPEQKLTCLFMQELTGLSMLDVYKLTYKEVVVEPRPKANKNGQFSLF